MSKTSKYFVPVELSVKQYPGKISIHRYKIFADDTTEHDFTKIHFLDIHGVIMGIHLPTKLKSNYDKTIEQMRANAGKVASEIKNSAAFMVGTAGSVVGEMKELIGDVAGDMKSDVSSLAKHTTKLVGKIKKSLTEKTKEETPSKENTDKPASSN